MRRLIASVFILMLSYLVSGCSHIKAMPGDIVSTVGGWFGGSKGADADGREKPAICLLVPPDDKLLAAANDQSKVDDGSCVQVPQTTHDFGQIQGDAELVHDFKVMNRCSKALKIKSIRPG
jgi:hypothetical protein